MFSNIINFVKYFKQKASLAKGCNPSFITLIRYMYKIIKVKINNWMHNQ